MQHLQQRTLDSLRRVQDFVDAHAAELGALKDSEGGRQLEDAIAEVATHTDEQSSTDLAMSGQVSRQRALESDLRAKHMKPIATFARAKLRGVPDFAALTKSGAGLIPKALVRAARAMATAGAPQADAFTKAGFPSDTIAQLGAAATALESSMTDRANAQVRRVGATKGISQALVRGREAVAMLNAVVSKQFADDKTFLAAWRAAHRITKKAGLARVVASIVPSLSPVPASPAAAQPVSVAA